MNRPSLGALATALIAGLISVAAPASAATISYTISGTTLNDGYLFGHPDPVGAPLPFSMTLYLEDDLPPTADGRTSDTLLDDPRDSYTIGGQQAFYWGLGGFVRTEIDSTTGLRQLVLAGDTIIDFGFAKWRTGYQFVLESAAFTADYTLAGIFTDANANLNRISGQNTTITQVYDPDGSYNDARITYLDVDKLVITNHPSAVPPEVPVPPALPMFGTALAVLGVVAVRARRFATARVAPTSGHHLIAA